MLALEQTGENSCLVMSDEPWICQRGSSASPGASATHFLWNPRVLPLHLCVAACGRPTQSSLWRKVFINSPVRSAGLELAPRLVTCNPIVCFFASSWSRVPGSFPDRQATRWATQAAAGHGTSESPQSAILDRGALLQRAWCGSPASWWRSEFLALLEASVWGGFNLLLPRPCLQRLAFSWI